MKTGRNLGRTDRRIRFYLAMTMVILGLWLFNGAQGSATGVIICCIASIPFITALIAICPICRLFKIHTLSDEELRIYGNPYRSSQFIA
jgi:hypothetical protein